MAFVQGYQHDVFISYAHEDDREWVNRLIARLEPAIKQRLGVKPSIWIDDEKLRASRDFSNEIPESVRSSAAFLLLPSPTYVRSRYCVEVECKVFAETYPARRSRFASKDFANESAGGEAYVIKPAFGSEGDSITIVDPGRDEVRRSMCTSYPGEAHVYQQFVSLPTRDLMTEHGVQTLHVVTSCFLVSGRPSGIIFRAGGEITGEDMNMRITSAAVKSICLALVVLGTRGIGAQSSGAAVDKNLRVPVGFHEFEMFGDSAVYLSHYPMFGSIHAYQVLLEVKLTGDGSDPRQLYLSHKQKNPLTRYSLSPETTDGEMHYWVMPDVIKTGQRFRANIHWQKSAGHPQYISRNVTVEIVKVIHFRLFQPDDKKPDVLSYLLFGNASEAFLAHYIASYPDFDHIVAVTGDTGKLVQGATGTATLVTIPGRENVKGVRLLKKDEKVVARVNGNGEELKLGVKTQIHYEAGLEIQR